MDQSLFKLLGKCATIPFVKNFTRWAVVLDFANPETFLLRAVPLKLKLSLLEE